MNVEIKTAARIRAFCVLLLVAVNAVFAEPVRAAEASQPSHGAEVIVSTEPMRLETEGEGVHGRLLVPAELITDGGNDLVFTITALPLFGRVGVAGDDEDFFENRTARLSNFAYRPREDYVGEDKFSYSVRNDTTGMVFENTVVINVKPAPAVELDKFVVSSTREHAQPEHTVALMTRPNIPLTQKIPSHEDYMAEAERAAVVDRQVVWVLDEDAKPQNGTAKIDRQTGELVYTPNPGFIGQDRFGYYTYDENNTQLGVENQVVVTVEPIRDYKKMVADRSRSREVDLVFVINNSPSMAPHQARIAENLRRFRQLFDERQLDYRIGVLTTDFVNVDSRRSGSDQYYKSVRGAELDREGNPVLDWRKRPKQFTKRVASNGSLVTLPVMDQPWVTPQTPDSIFAELVKVGTNGDSNRTAFTSVYNFVAGYSNKQHTMLRPDATTIVVFFMDEEETRMALWKDLPNGTREAEWIENGKLPDLLDQYNARNPGARQTLDGYINYWVLRPFIIVKGNQRGKIEMHAVVSPNNISHRRAAELTGGTVLNIESDFSEPLAALGDRIADTVAVALDPVGPGARFARRTVRVLVDGQEVKRDPQNGYIYDERTHSIRFQGAAKKQAFAAKIEITYEEHR